MMTRGYAFAQTDGDRERRIRQYMSLVHRVARWIVRRLPSMVDLQDLQQVGVIGLIDADRSVRLEPLRAFRGLCRVPHQGCDLDHLRQVDHLSRRHRGRINALREATERLRSESGQEPSSAELAQELGVTVEQVESLRTEASSSWMSYDEAGGIFEGAAAAQGVRF